MKITGIDDDITGAIFDMDGLLVNTEKLYWLANIQAAKEANLNIPEDSYLSLIGVSVSGFESFYHKYFKTVAQRDQFIKRTDDLVWQWIKQGKVHLKPGVEQVLQLFKEKNIKMAVASGNYQKVVNKVLQITKIRSYFDFILSYADIQNGHIKAKPAPDIYLLAAQKINMSKKNLLIFEDSPTGVLAAKNAGIKCVMIPDLKQPTLADRHNATLIVKNFFDFIGKNVQ